MNEQNNNAQNNGQSIPTINANQNIPSNTMPQQNPNINMNPPQSAVQSAQETEFLGTASTNNIATNQPTSSSQFTQNLNNIAQQQTISNNANTNSSVEPQEKGGCFKQILLFTFLIGLIAFVFFLPDISKIIQNGSGTGTADNIRTGAVVCTMEQEDDTSSISYKMRFNYIDNMLKTSSMTITLQDENDQNINAKNIECQNMSQISQTITGISVQCSPSENLLIITETYEHETIDKNKLTKFTEAGGTYPEFDYEEDINDVHAKMKKNGYICKDE